MPSGFQFGLWGCGGVLAVQTQPKQVFELGEVVLGDGGDVDGGHIVGEGFHNGLHLLGGGGVAFGEGHEVALVEQFGVVLVEFIPEDFVFADDLVGAAHALLADDGDHKEQHGVAFDVSQEAQADALAFGGALDDAGDVGDDERLEVAVGHHSEVWGEGGEGVVGDFGFGVGEFADEGGLASIGEAHEAHVGEHFEFEGDPALGAGFAGLGEARGLHRGTLEVHVAESAAATFHNDEFLAVVEHLADGLAGLHVFDDGAEGHLDDGVGAVLAEALVFLAEAAVFGEHVFGVAEV